jgi:hypothetical protein
MMFLGQLGLGRIEKEWIVYQAEVADIEASLRDCRARRAALVRELEEARQRLAQAQEPRDLGQRVAGEARTDESIVRLRRARQQDQARARESEAVRGLSARLDALDAQIAHFDAQIRIRLRIAQRRAAMIEAHVRRRCAAYLSRLVRKHPQGTKLNEILRPRWPEQPEWARAHEGRDLDVPPGVGAEALLRPVGS